MPSPAPLCIRGDVCADDFHLFVDVSEGDCSAYIGRGSGYDGNFVRRQPVLVRGGTVETDMSNGPIILYDTDKSKDWYSGKITEERIRRVCSLFILVVQHFAQTPALRPQHADGDWHDFSRRK